jgi:hypothetical protein
MAITYKSGRRIQATSTDFAGTPAVAGGWKELARTTLGTAGNTISVTGLADKRYYMILNDTVQAGAGDHYLQFNGDTGSNYSGRRSANGATDTTATGTSEFEANDQTDGSGNLGVSYWSNLATKEKLGLGHFVSGSTAGAGTAPYRSEFAMKWANTSTAISSYQHKGNSNFSSGSEVVVLGWDDSDTHTTNFWEELYTDTKTSDNQEFSTGTIAAKKYLWLQFYQQGHTGNSYLNFNADSGSNYARSHSINGASDASVTSQTTLNNVLTGGTADHHTFTNMFIINNSANEKLCTFNTVFNAAGGTGAGNAPQRIEGVTKWSNTSAQITSLTVTDNGGAGFDIGSTLKIWGSD